MKLNVDKSSLHAALTVASEAVEKKATNPVLECLHLRTDGARLVVSGTEGTVASVHSLEAHVEAPGNVGANAADLVRMVGAMPDGGINLTVTDGSMIQITGATKRRFELSGLPGEEMPELGAVPSSSGWCAAVDLVAALATVRHAVSTDESRPGHRIARLRWADGVLSAGASDGLRLAMARRECDGGPLDVVVSSRAIPMALAFASGRGRIDVGTDENSLFVSCDEGWQRYGVPSQSLPWDIMDRVMSQVQGQTPVRVDGGQLTKAIRAISVAQGTVSRGGAKGAEGMFVDVKRDRIVVSLARASDEVPCESETEATFCVYPNLLLDALKVCGEDTTLRIGGELDPLGVESGCFSGLVMGMRR